MRPVIQFLVSVVGFAMMLGGAWLTLGKVGTSGVVVGLALLVASTLLLLVGYVRYGKGDGQPE